MAVIPAMSERTAPYWAAAREGRLAVQECQECRQVWHPPLPRCPHCHSGYLAWRDLSGDGTVYSYTVVRHATHFAFADKIPYILAIVELAEGPRLVTALTGTATEEVRVGLAVRVVFRAVTDTVTLPCFEPAAARPAGHSGSLGGLETSQRSTITVRRRLRRTVSEITATSRRQASRAAGQRNGRPTRRQASGTAGRQAAG